MVRAVGVALVVWTAAALLTALGLSYWLRRRQT